MRVSSEVVCAAALGLCATLVAYGEGGPNNVDAAQTVRTHIIKTKAMRVQDVKSSGCSKTKEGEMKEPGVFYRCAVELDVPGYAKGKARAYLHEVNGQWVVLGID